MVYRKYNTYKKGYLKVSNKHSIYYELSGNPKGIPVLFVHGGPGGGIREKDKRFFNPKKFNLIMFDQRGAGKSRPQGSLENNTTFNLKEDIEKLRKFLGIDKFILFGVSWGTTLSLVYAINYPQNVLSMVLNGIFLGTKSDINYMLQQPKNSYPEMWNEFMSLVPKDKDVVNYYYKKSLSKDKKTSKKFIDSWAKYELSISKLNYSKKKIDKAFSETTFNFLALTEMYYFKNNCFLKPGYILNNVNKIKDIPVTIVHGRYDQVCNPQSAYKLHKKLNKSKLYFTVANHSSSDKENEKILVKEMDKISKKL